MDPDLVLLERWRKGDQQAGQDLFARHFADIYRFFEHKVGGEADDLSQRTFLACVAARDQFRSQSTFRTYLFTIARNEFYAHLRRLQHGEHLDFEVTSIAEILPSPASLLDRARQVGRLREALRQLPAEQQLLLELHYWHDLDAAALSEVFGTPPGTIRVRLLRARQALRSQMAEIKDDLVGAERADPLTASLLAPERESSDEGQA
jgi:RNA polymerase sigma-70 factor (ECF subfamily)